jgi:regulatory protein YycI of two-component signal transduction system YycFG
MKMINIIIVLIAYVILLFVFILRRRNNNKRKERTSINEEEMALANIQMKKEKEHISSELHNWEIDYDELLIGKELGRGKINQDYFEI